MNFKIRGENITVTNALKEYTEKKILKLEKYFEETLTSDVFVNFKVLKKEKRVEVTIPFSSLLIRAEESHRDMYAAVDLVIEKLIRQIQKYKAKATNWKRKKSSWVAGSSAPQLVMDEEEFPVVRQKNFHIKPMDAEEAVLHMNMLGHTFFIYEDSHDGHTNVVYKRKDGKYGLITS